jgi:SAM-dependent methyltransferase
LNGKEVAGAIRPLPVKSTAGIFRVGMLIYDALVLTKVAAMAGAKTNVLTLGVPTLNFSDADYRHACRKTGIAFKPDRFSNHRGFFSMLGYAEVKSLDISAYEGAEIVGDLNDPELPGKVGETFDLVYDCGTLEHIFDVTHALRSMDQLVRLGGIAVHASPTNGFMDHGFWQLSPDMFRAFYSAKGYRTLTSAVFTMGFSPLAVPAEENIYRKKGRGFIAENLVEAIAVFAATKEYAPESTPIRMQDYYTTMHEGTSSDHRAAFFIPYGSRRRASLLKFSIIRIPFTLLRWSANMLRRKLAR